MSRHIQQSVTPDRFRRACGRFATGVTVVTVCDPNRQPHGITVNSFTSVSLDPPLILICIDLRTSILDHFRESSVFAINILEASQQELSARFASSIDDRFQGVRWSLSDDGAPLLEDTMAGLECSVERVLVEGDHTIVIGRALRVWSRDGDPLLFFASRYRTLEG
ncbi:MAG: flavin reductase family protein [Bryobacteraceae bacterium]